MPHVETLVPFTFALPLMNAFRQLVRQRDKREHITTESDVHGMTRSTLRQPEQWFHVFLRDYTLAGVTRETWHHSGENTPLKLKEQEA